MDLIASVSSHAAPSAYRTTATRPTPPPFDPGSDQERRRPLGRVTSLRRTPSLRRASTLRLAAAFVLAALPACTDGGGNSVIDPGNGNGELPELEIFDVSPSPGRTTSDLWVHGSHAYTGTWALLGPATAKGNTLFVWDLADPAAPVIVDSVTVDAGIVNDVKVSPDGSLGVLTHEQSDDNLNGITLLDLSRPGSPTVIRRHTEGLERGVHNVWLENDYVYVAVDDDGGLRILDVSFPVAPAEVARYYAGDSNVHDVYVRNGLAFVSHWNAGLVILDVGAGIEDGSPEEPRVVSTTEELGGETHNAWYWPDRDYVFVGEEDPTAPGIMRVLDVEDMTAPEVVATYGVPGDTPHNFWLDEENEVLYMAWYTEGVRALDVSGELVGDLATQDRELAVGTYGPGDGWCAMRKGPTCTWAPQLHDGFLYLSDMRHGLVTAAPAP